MGNLLQDPEPHTFEEVTQVYNLCSKEVKRQSQISRRWETKPDKISKNILNQLFESFERYPQYTWGDEILPLFKKHFMKDFELLWRLDKQKFYQLLSDSCGVKDKDRTQTFQSNFYLSWVPMQKKKAFQSSEYVQQISALNSSIMEEDPEMPIIIDSRRRDSKPFRTFVERLSHENRLEEDEPALSLNRFYSQHEYDDNEIERSSVLIPETVFVDRLDEPAREKVNDMLSFYRNFSSCLQMMIRTVNILSCPIRHFQACLKKTMKLKKIKKTAGQSALSNTRQAALLRKNKESNNRVLLLEIRDFIDAYTQFIWKYLDLYQMNEGPLGEVVTFQTASGVVLKLVWSFAGWIGDRGSEWEQFQLTRILKKLDRGNKNIKIPQNVIQLGCSMKNESNPQKYLKLIVIIYRELGKVCENADELLTYYERLIVELIKRNCHQKIFRMKTIIEKLMNVENSGGEIGYAWATWSISIEFLKKNLSHQNKSMIQPQ